ncbi:MAG TPA: WD40 repeat domain-containing protein, partial [Caulobacterales bacterium]|nr:WD40 repeat domain-containing protein [Caulobacterales bacterium]
AREPAATQPRGRRDASQGGAAAAGGGADQGGGQGGGRGANTPITFVNAVGVERGVYAVARTPQIYRVDVELHSICRWSSKPPPSGPGAADQPAGEQQDTRPAFTILARFPRSRDGVAFLLAGSPDGSLHVFNNRGVEIGGRPADAAASASCASSARGFITALAVDATGRRAALGRCDGKVQQLAMQFTKQDGKDRVDFTDQRELQSYDRSVSGVRYLSDGRLASSSGGAWRVQRDADVVSEGHTENDARINAIDVSSDNTIAAATTSGVYLWRIGGAPEQVPLIQGRGHYFSEVTFGGTDSVAARGGTFGSYTPRFIFVFPTNPSAVPTPVVWEVQRDGVGSGAGGLARLDSQTGSRWVAMIGDEAKLIEWRQSAGQAADGEVGVTWQAPLALPEDLRITDISRDRANFLAHSDDAGPSVMALTGGAGRQFEGHQFRVSPTPGGYVRRTDDAVEIFASGAETPLKTISSRSGFTDVALVRDGRALAVADEHALTVYRTSDGAAFANDASLGANVIAAGADRLGDAIAVVASDESYRNATISIVRPQAERLALTVTKIYEGGFDDFLGFGYTEEGATVVQRHGAAIEASGTGGHVTLDSTGLQGVVRAALVGRNGQWIVGLFSGHSPRVWNARTGARITDLAIDGSISLQSYAVSETTRHFAVFNQGKIDLWSTANWSKVSTTNAPFAESNAFTLSDDGNVGALRRGAEIAFVPLNGRGPAHTVSISADCPYAMQTSPDGSQVAVSCSSRRLAIYDVNGLVAGLRRPAGDVFSTTLMGAKGAARLERMIGDGAHAASIGAEDGMLRFWSTSTLTEDREHWPAVAAPEVRFLASSRAGDRVLAASANAFMVIAGKVQTRFEIDTAAPPRPRASAEPGGADAASDQSAACLVIGADMNPKGNRVAIADDCGGLTTYAVDFRLDFGPARAERHECETIWLLFQRCLTVRKLHELEQKSAVDVGEADESDEADSDDDDEGYVDYLRPTYADDGVHLVAVRREFDRRGGTESASYLAVYDDTRVQLLRTAPIMALEGAHPKPLGSNNIEDLRLSRNGVAMIRTTVRLLTYDIYTGVQLSKIVLADAPLFAAPPGGEHDEDDIVLVVQAPAAPAASASSEEERPTQQIRVGRLALFLSPFGAREGGLSRPLFTHDRRVELRNLVRQLALHQRGDLSDDEARSFLLLDADRTAPNRAAQNTRAR